MQFYMALWKSAADHLEDLARYGSQHPALE